jgi:TPR repeat protein
MAAYWFNKSAELGNSEGMLYYGLCLREGKGVKLNHEMAAHWFKKSAELGNSEGMIYYGLCLKKGKGVKLNHEMAVHWFKKSAELGNSDGMLYYGLCLRKGKGVRLNHEMAGYWLKQSAERENLRGICYYNLFFEKYRIIESNRKMPIHLFKQSTELGNSEEMVNYGICLMEGQDIQQNLEAATAFWLKQSAELGNSEGMINYGICLMEGLGVRQNCKAAAYWFKQSAELGNSEGMLYYGICFKEGQGVQRNHEAASYWFRQSAELRNSEGMINYGLCLREHKKSPRNLQEAFCYYLKAHKLGNIMGSYIVIDCRLYGLGTCYNPRKAFKQWKKLPIQVFQLVITLLGEFFFEGSLFGKSLSKAFEFYDLLLDEPKFNLRDLVYLRLRQISDPSPQLSEKKKVHEDFLITVNNDRIKSNYFIITTHSLYDFSFPNEAPQRNCFEEIKTVFQRNPTNMLYCAILANIYFKGIGTKQNVQKSKLLYKKLHQKKSDCGTFGLLACMKKENTSLRSRFEICLERTDTNNGKILYKIGKGHLTKIYGEKSNFEEGISFLKKSISRGFIKAIPFLCLYFLKRRFGEEISPAELYSESEKLKDSSSSDDCVYFGICLFYGIGIPTDKEKGLYLIDLAASKGSKDAKYYQKILSSQEYPRTYSIIDYSIQSVSK